MTFATLLWQQYIKVLNWNHWVLYFSDVYDDEVSTVLSSDRFEPVVGQKLAKVNVYACTCS